MSTHLNKPLDEALDKITGTKHAPEEAPENKMLPEEYKFDKAVYGGISYAAQAGTGILLTNWIKNGGGKKHFQKLAETLTGARGASAVEKASSFIIVSTMIMVGNAFLLPVKWLENRKPKIIRGMVERSNANREHSGHAPTEEELAQQQTRLEKLEKEPKQDWWSLGGGRLFSLVGVYLVERGIGGPRNEVMSIGTTKAIQETLSGLGMKNAAKSKTLENYLRIGFYDMFYSTVSAGGLYIYSHFVKPPKKDKVSQAEAISEVAATALEQHNQHEYAEREARHDHTVDTSWAEKHPRAEKPAAHLAEPSQKKSELPHPTTFTERAEAVSDAQPTLAV